MKTLAGVFTGSLSEFFFILDKSRNADVSESRRSRLCQLASFLCGVTLRAKTTRRFCVMG